MDIVLQHQAPEGYMLAVARFPARLAEKRSGRTAVQREHVRKLLQHVPGNHTQIRYDRYGKPCLEGGGSLGISHSENYVAVIYGKNSGEVAVDVEKIFPMQKDQAERIERVARRFMRPVEWESVTDRCRAEHLYLYWGAKEVLYKLYGRKQLRYHENILVSPFSYSESGATTGRVRKDGYDKIFSLEFRRAEECMVVWGWGINEIRIIN